MSANNRPMPLPGFETGFETEIETEIETETRSELESEFDAMAHFRLMTHAAVFRLIHYLRLLATETGDPLDACLDSYPFLADYFEAFRSLLPESLGWEETLGWWQRQIEWWEAAAPSRCALPLRRLASEADLSFDARLALVYIGLMEDDIQFGALFAALQDPLPSRRMSHGLLVALLGPGAPSAVRRLLQCGLIRAENQDAPRADWILRVPLPIWDALHGPIAFGAPGALRLYSYGEFPPLKRLILEPSLRPRILRLPALLAQGVIGGLVLRGMEGSGRRTLLGSLARSLRRDLLVLQWDRSARSDHTTGGAQQTSTEPSSRTARESSRESVEERLALLGPLSLLLGALPVLSPDLAPGETRTFEALAGYRGIVGLTLPREGGVEGSLIERTISLTLPSPTWKDRMRFWQRLLPPDMQADIPTLAARFRLPLGALARVARIASTYAALEGRTTLLATDVQQGARALNRQTLDLLAQRLSTETPGMETEVGREIEAQKKLEIENEVDSRSPMWRQLVVNPTTAAELDDLERRCRYREQLAPHLGTAFPGAVNPGVRALFNGPSGNGKTLAAKVLAGVLQMDLYRVDLAAIVNKYIGETEKNLGILLARAEELDVILLIDEGDSLLSGRTDVRSANDRYANMETNYLLQRLETYEGIVFVTTNASSRVDTAFERRFDAVISFSLPGPEERRKLWEHHLPVRTTLRSSFVNEIATTCVLTGGQIRNAALHAALLAASQIDSRTDSRTDSTEQGMTEQAVRTAIRREYRKAGAACPLPDIDRPARFDPISAFLLEAN